MGRAMRDSGVEWIGDIPEDWNIGTIGQLYSERKEKVSDRDYTPLSVTMQGIVPQLSTAAKTDAHDDRKLVRKGDFAINSRSDRRGSCGISDRDGSVSLINTILAPHENMNAGYYNWLFHTSAFSDEFYKWGHGIVDDLWTTNWQDMKHIRIPLPSVQEQERISICLDKCVNALNVIISKTKESIEEYKKLRQGVITNAITKGIRGKRPMKVIKSPFIEEIPLEWDYRKQSSVAKRIVVGVVVRPSEYFDDEGMVPFIRGMNVKEYEITDGDFVYISEESNKQLEKSIIHTGDVLIVRDGSIGVSCVVPPKYDGANVVSLIIVTPSDEMDSQYLCYLLNSDLGKRQFEITKIGSALTHTSVASVSKIGVLVPPKEEQDEIVEYLNAKRQKFDALIKKKEDFVAALSEYKRSLIFEYVTGKKEVPSA